jgi:hypothetical protein
MRDLRREELEEAVELVRVAPEGGRELGRIGLGALHGADLELEPLAEAGDAAEHAHGVALGEAAVQELDVVPHPGLDPAGAVDELERQVGGTFPRPQPLLARDRVDALDDAILRQLGDAAHSRSL